MNPCSAPQLAVIIPNWNGCRFLRTCLGALRLQSYRPFQTWLVDNGSEDESLALVQKEFPEVTILPLAQNYGFSTAINQGIMATATPFVALLNNDTEADPHWLETAVRAFDTHPEADYIASRIMNFHQRRLLDSAGDYLTRTGLPLKRGADQPAEGQWLRERWVMGASAGAAIYRRSAFLRTGIFDPGYFLYLEDVDWCLRSALLGLRCLYVPEAVVYHIEGGSDPLRQSFLDRGESTRRAFHTPQRTYWITRNRIRLLCKNYPAALFFLYSPLIFYGFARSALFHLFRRGLFWPFARGLIRGLVEIPQCLSARREIQGRRTVSIRNLQKILFQ